MSGGGNETFLMTSPEGDAHVAIAGSDVLIDNLRYAIRYMGELAGF